MLKTNSISFGNAYKEQYGETNVKVYRIKAVSCNTKFCEQTCIPTSISPLTKWLTLVLCTSLVTKLH